MIPNEQHLSDVLITTFDEEVRFLQDIAMVQNRLENIIAAREGVDMVINNSLESRKEIADEFLPRELTSISVTKQTLMQSAVTGKCLLLFNFNPRQRLPQFFFECNNGMTFY